MNWGALLQGALRGDPDKVPKEWKTSRQIAIELGKSEVHTRQLLLRGVASKKIESRRFRISREDGVIRQILHYRPATARKQYEENRQHGSA